MEEHDILIDFKNAVISFCDALIEQFPEVGELILARIYLKDQVDIVDTMELFVYHLNKNDGKLRTMIDERNETFFLQNNIFDTFNTGKITRFKKLWKTKLDKEDKIIVWKWIDSFVKLADKFIKSKLNLFKKSGEEKINDDTPISTTTDVES